MTYSDAHEPRAVQVNIRGESLGRPFLLRCRNCADENLLSGWGKAGLDDADLFLQGLGYQVDNFLNWMRGGVEGARISRISVLPAERQLASDFQILD